MKQTKEQRAVKSLNPSLDPSPQDKKMYEVATYRSARKHRKPFVQRNAK
jgi:hypothetical protein